MSYRANAEALNATRCFAVFVSSAKLLGSNPRKDQSQAFERNRWRGLHAPAWEEMPRTKPSFEPHVQLQPISFGSGYFRAAFPAAASGQFCSALLAPGPRTQTSKVEISRSDPLLAVFLALRPRNVTWHVAPQIGILNSHNGALDMVYLCVLT